MLRFRRFASTYEQAKVLRKYPVGATLHGYEIRRVQPVPELRLTAVDLQHKQTGSQHLHIDRNDNNNVFGICFKTNPPDATGVPHILEHTVLCGSQKYPVRDPFFKMLNRSLANFMNAMTGTDYTFYPFSTTNAKDFANLRDVYLDATLNPLLKLEDFQQEGWRLEHKNLDDINSDITFKGVVYNEMKGQMSNADYYFWRRFQEAIYPALNNSGGDPRKMTDLHYDDLLHFHSVNYHPSNSRTFTYGNFPLEDTLERLNREFIGFGKRPVNPKRRLLMPVELKDGDIEVNEVGQIDPMLPPERQVKTSMTWICGSPQDTYETFLLKLLGSLIMDGQSSVMYQRLIESGLGHDFSANSGVEPTTAVNFLTIGVQGVEDVDKFRQVTLDTFKELASAKFDKVKVEAILQQIELSKKDQKPDFGLQILASLVPSWTNGFDPFDNLLIDETLLRFKEEWAERGDSLFQDLVKKYILDRPCFKFTMRGSPEFAKSLEEDERERLQRKIEALNESDRKIIFDRGNMLKEKQKKVEDLSCLPSLKLNDIPRDATKYPLEPHGSVTLRLTDTNGITYIRGKKLLNDKIPKELYPYLPLFVDSLTSLGTKDEPFSEIENKIKLYTGGISTDVKVVSDPLTLKPRLSFDFRGWSLNPKTDKIFEYWEELILQTDFRQNKETLKILLRMLAASNTSSVSDSGHTYAKGYAAAHVSRTNAINETLGGIEQLKLIQYFNKIMDDEELFQREIIEKLEQLQQLLISGTPKATYFVTTDTPAQFATVSKQIEKFESNFSRVSKMGSTNSQSLGTPLLTESYPLLPGQKPTLLKFPFQTHHTALTKPTGIPYTHADSAPLQVLSSILSLKHLHREIRERNGAYGAGAQYDALNGTFNYFSYRDPNPVESLQVYQREFPIEQEDLVDGKLRLFQSVDAPISRRSEGTWWFENGIDDRMRQERRERLLDVSLGDLHDVMERYLVGKPGFEVIVGPAIEGCTTEPEWDITSVEIEEKEKEN